MTEDKKPCKRPGKDVSSAKRALDHMVKMRVKKNLNNHNRLRLLEHPEYVLANLSPKHEAFGETPEQQTKRMVTEKSS